MALQKLNIPGEWVALLKSAHLFVFLLKVDNFESVESIPISLVNIERIWFHGFPEHLARNLAYELRVSLNDKEETLQPKGARPQPK